VICRPRVIPRLSQNGFAGGGKDAGKRAWREAFWSAPVFWRFESALSKAAEGRRSPKPCGGKPSTYSERIIGSEAKVEGGRNETEEPLRSK
jgi:hypothetical protein